MAEKISKGVPVLPVRSPTDPVLNAQGEIDPDVFDDAVRSRAEWRALSELAEEAGNLTAESVALKSKGYSWSAAVNKDYLTTLDAIVAKTGARIRRFEDR